MQDTALKRLVCSRNSKPTKAQVNGIVCIKQRNSWNRKNSPGKYKSSFVVEGCCDGEDEEIFLIGDGVED